MSDSLKRVSTRRINKVWDEYRNIKERIIDVSEDLAEIRQNRNGSLKNIEKYRPVMGEMLDIYKTYITNIEPKIKKKSSFMERCTR